jgi:aldehyde dehydrogenase (NAD+)
VKNSGLGIKEGVIEAIKFMTTVKTFSLPWQVNRAQNLAM